jgi:hypothetical protein
MRTECESRNPRWMVTMISNLRGIVGRDILVKGNYIKSKVSSDVTPIGVSVWPFYSQVWYKVGSSPMEGHGCRVAPCREVRILSWLRWSTRWLRVKKMNNVPVITNGIVWNRNNVRVTKRDLIRKEAYRRIGCESPQLNLLRLWKVKSFLVRWCMVHWGGHTS